VEPSRPEQLDERLTRRGTESAEAIERRLEVARRELGQAHLYRHRVVNENVDEAVAGIIEILRQAGLESVAASEARPC
jgi:guanylate kinase